MNINPMQIMQMMKNKNPQELIISMIGNKNPMFNNLMKLAKDGNKSEIENIAKAGPIAYADYFVDNNGTILDLHQRIDTILGE